MQVQTFLATAARVEVRFLLHRSALLAARNAGKRSQTEMSQVRCQNWRGRLVWQKVRLHEVDDPRYPGPPPES